jgi:hypothetical protein
LSKLIAVKRNMVDDMTQTETLDEIISAMKPLNSQEKIVEMGRIDSNISKFKYSTKAQGVGV